MSDFRPQVKKNALSNSKISLAAPNNVGKKATMIFKLKKNNPQIMVYTNEPNDANENYGRIDAALDTPVFNAYLEMLREAATNTNFKKEQIHNKNYIFPGGKRSEAPVHVSTLWVGRDEDGTVWTAVSAKGRPMIKFSFISPDFHTFAGADGNPMPRGDASKYITLGFVNMLTQIMNHLQVIEYEEPVIKQQQQNNRNGNYNSSNNNSSGGDDFGSINDIPF